MAIKDHLCWSERVSFRESLSRAMAILQEAQKIERDEELDAVINKLHEFWLSAYEA